MCKTKGLVLYAWEEILVINDMNKCVCHMHSCRTCRKCFYVVYWTKELCFFKESEQLISLEHCRFFPSSKRMSIWAQLDFRNGLFGLKCSRSSKAGVETVPEPGDRSWRDVFSRCMRQNWIAVALVDSWASREVIITVLQSLFTLTLKPSNKLWVGKHFSPLCSVK